MTPVRNPVVYWIGVKFFVMNFSPVDFGGRIRDF